MIIEISLQVLGLIFLILVYCVCGIIFSEWDKNDYPWKTLYHKILKRRLDYLCKKKPNNYQYDAEKDFYWYDCDDVNKCGRNAEHEESIEQYMENWSILMYMLWPIFGLIEYIRKKIYEETHFISV